MSAARLPDFLIVGAARAGTTSLASWLDEHPGVFLARRKEIFFFDRPERFARGIDWYASHFAGARRTDAAGEASTSYMFYPDAVERMAQLLPDARLVALLRHPVDRAYSHYCFASAWGAEDRTFERAVREELDGRAPVVGQEYVARGHYHSQLVRLTRHFPREALCVSLFADLRDRPRETFRSVCRFVGVGDTVVPELVGQALNASARIRSRWLFRRLSRWRSWARSPSALTARIDAMNSAPPPPLDPELRAELLDHYLQPNQELSQWLGRDLTAWNR